MIIITKPSLLEEYIERQRALGRLTGFVPTMGALHAGHLDLVRTSATQCRETVVSIFVNPTQFTDQGDFNKYPKTIEKDILTLESTAATVLFLPSVEDIYPNGLSGLEHYDLGPIETVLEGRFRKGHFQGVCQVMNRLLHIVRSDRLFMGQKDYQQCLVVSRLLELTGSSTLLIRCPTVRDPDGLAMSSRNLRLTPEQRLRAPLIYQMLTEAKKDLQSGADSTDTQRKALETLEKAGFRPDYVEIADALTLQPPHDQEKQLPRVILVAAFLGEIRLIDNLLV